MIGPLTRQAEAVVEILDTAELVNRLRHFSAEPSERLSPSAEAELVRAVLDVREAGVPAEFVEFDVPHPAVRPTYAAEVFAVLRARRRRDNRPPEPALVTSPAPRSPEHTAEMLALLEVTA